MIEIGLAIAGAAGGFMKSLVEQKGRVMLPAIEVTEGAKYVHLGAIANMALGMIVAFYTTSDPSSAFTAGITAAFFAEKLLERSSLLPVGKILGKNERF